ncbi:MAG: ATP-binding protein, partial [Mollicutes bacterium]|nr:ATP-binding protein [Mollicutes bacterium]
FEFPEYISADKYISYLVAHNNRRSQIININLQDIDDTLAKTMVKVFARLLFNFTKTRKQRASIPFHLFLEEAHRYIQKDNDTFLIGYNIFDRIAKEGRKYGLLLDLITQRPVEMSDTVVSQISNFLIFKMTHPLDLDYIEKMLPNMSADVLEKLNALQPGTCVAFGSAFKIPMICRLDIPNPAPYSSNADVLNRWKSQ